MRVPSFASLASSCAFSRALVCTLALGLGSSLSACGGSNNGNTNPDGGDNTGGCFEGQVRFDGVCVTAPTVEAERTQCGDVTDFCDTSGAKTPVLDCLTTPHGDRPTTPEKVTLTGYVHPFSGGKSNSTVTVQIYRAADLESGADITSVAPLVQKEFTFDPSQASDPSQFRACDTDPQVGCVPVDPSACDTVTCNDGLGGRQDDNKYCSVDGNCNDRLRWERRYSIDDVPTNTPLVIRTSGEGGMSSTAWSTLVQWNVFLATDDKQCGGDHEATDCLDTSDMDHPKYQLNVNVLSVSDYTNIPVTAGLAGGISIGQSGIAGEVHDCDNIRVGNVQVGVLPAGDRLTYFNGNPYMTLPDSSRAATGSDRLGLYASLNVNPGKVKIEAVGLVGGKQVSLGSYTAYTYPDSIAVVNLNGGKPVQTTP